MNKTDYTLNLKPAVYEVLEKVFRDNQIFSAQKIHASFLNITGQREARLYECKN